VANGKPTVGKPLGQLERCNNDIKEYWEGETSFSDWLFEEDNLDFLTDSLGIPQIHPDDREANAGRFRADIIGTFIDDANSRVIIENKFGNSDHDHIGKALTYAAIRDADCVIWIVEKALDEHSATVEWLNNNMSEKSFYLVELELWRIGESQVAPRFNIVQRPNALKQALDPSKGKGSDIRYEFWDEFIKYISGHKEFLKVFPGSNSRSAVSSYALGFSKGLKGYSVSPLIFGAERITEVAVEVYIPDNMDLYYKFEEHKEEINAELGLDPEWQPLENKKASRIRYTRPVRAKETHDSLCKWLAEECIKFKETFTKYD